MLLAQVNIARLRAPLDAPELQGFVEGLAPINALADAAPGFVWRLQDESGDATSVVYDPDPLLIVNLSVWESAEALHAFTYTGPHVEFLRRRRDWFNRLATPHLALWWVDDQHRPTPAEAHDRLAHLEAHGPTPHAFTLSKLHGPEVLETI
ncbi:DUF3291 domain-containing protein [Deinococcus puniceus]|uniref:DUF3291 domain-containing protein n=1 Tax=Deinococcus puniceus TaxID=1182568 RepID=A0A172TBP5_9DEIO|nr:DUF3291 domain-containing protein [Deinococcus puniceus]ANE44223.1 hypothetical protein SU48_11130 [Deinococcus puniceus]